MDFSTRGHVPSQPNTNRFAPAGQQPTASDQDNQPNKSGNKTSRTTLWIRWALFLFLLCLLTLVVALLLFIAFGDWTHEGSYVNTSEYQAVEVTNTGANTPTYYYGNLTGIDNKYLVLSNAFVLTSGVSDTAVTVAPLSCVSANSASQLVINRAQVILWNNLNPNSTATQAIQQQAKASGSCPNIKPTTAPAKNTNGTSAGSQLPKQSDQTTSQPASQTNSSSTSPSSPSNSTTTNTSASPSNAAAPKVP